MTTIGADTRIDGRVEGEGDVVVHGRVDGTVALSDTLTIADGGYVSGDIEARVIVIEGAAAGTLRASEVVHLTETAQVEGEVFATAVRLDPGARLKGRVEMDVEAAPPRPQRTKRPATKKPARESKPAQTTSTQSSSNASASSSGSSSSSSSSSSSPSSSSSNGAQASSSTTSAPSAVVDVDPDELTVKELRELLQERDLPVSGTKSELIDRLRNGG